MHNNCKTFGFLKCLMLGCMAAIFLSNPVFSQSMQMGTNFWFQDPNKGVKPFKDGVNFTDPSLTNPWRQVFLDEISMFKVLRFMDWAGTNNSSYHMWTQRAVKTDPDPQQYWVGKKDMAYEWMMDLCNRTNKDMWICLPHKVVNRNSGRSGNMPSDFVRKLAVLLKHGVDMKDINLGAKVGYNYASLASKDKQWFINNGGVQTSAPLRGDLKIYIEYSNEVWNTVFDQTNYAKAEGLAMGIDTDQWVAISKFSAYAHALIWQAFDDVFGPNNSRTIKVLGSQHGQTWHLDRKYEIFNSNYWSPKNQRPDKIAVAPYFGHNVNGSSATV